MSNKCFKKGCDGTLVFERVSGVKGYTCDVCGDWTLASTIEPMKMTRSLSTAATMIGDISVDCKLRAMTSERDYWKNRCYALEQQDQL